MKMTHHPLYLFDAFATKYPREFVHVLLHMNLKKANFIFWLEMYDITNNIAIGQSKRVRRLSTPTTTRNMCVVLCTVYSCNRRTTQKKRKTHLQQRQRQRQQLKCDHVLRASAIKICLYWWQYHTDIRFGLHSQFLFCVAGAVAFLRLPNNLYFLINVHRALVVGF